MSANNVVATWPQGDLSGVSVWLTPLTIGVKSLRLQKARSGGIDGGKPPGISDFHPSFLSRCTSPGTSGGRRKHLYSKHTCQVCIPHPYARGSG